MAREDALETTDDRLGEVLAAYLEAADSGWAPSRRAFLDRYPELRLELEAFFRSQDEVHDLAAPFRTGPGSTVSVARSNGGPTDPADGVTVALEAAQTGEGESLRSFGDYEVLDEIARGG